MKKTMLLTASLLAACSQSPAQLNVIDIAMIGPVLSSIKHEVGIYTLYRNGYLGPASQTSGSSSPVAFSVPLAPSPNLQALSSAVPKTAPSGMVGPGCIGATPVDFEITSIKISFATSEDSSVTGGISATIPIPPAGSSVGFGVTGGNENVDSEGLEFTEYPLNDLNRNYSDPNPGQPGQLALALISLREGLLQAAKAGPCFTDIDLSAKATDAPHQNTFTMGFTVTRQGGVSGTLKLTLVSLNAGATWKSTNGNTITVTFGQPKPLPAPAGKKPQPPPPFAPP